MSGVLRLSDIDSAAVLLSQGAHLRRTIAPEEDGGLVAFEIEARPDANETLAKFMSGNLVGNLRGFAEEQRRLRLLLRAARGQYRP